MILKFTQIHVKSTLHICVLIAFSIIAYILYCSFHKKAALPSIPTHLHKYLKCDVNDTFISLGDLVEKIERINERREVKHWQKYGPLTPDTPVIVVQVHRKLEKLQYLILSLAQVKDIENVLLIFSHSFYDERINYIIQQIDFCMVLQIFFPNSAQLYPNNFPGLDSEDCVNRTRGGYCVERDALITQTKQHWWWTANFVFVRLIWAPSHKDMVIFINEDTYVLPDLLHMLRVSKSSMRYVSDASILSFGRPLATGLDYNKLSVDIWKPVYENGLAFNRTTWQKISKLDSLYCLFDDTSWSYSLMHLFEEFPRGRVVTLACMVPRVMSTGMFRSGKDALQLITRIIRSDQLFPTKVQAVMLFGQYGRVFRHYRAPTRGNGGWSYSRDQQLCLEPLMSTSLSDESTTPPPVFTTEYYS